jgi:phospholipid-binding lipoprotein MlaA
VLEYENMTKKIRTIVFKAAGTSLLFLLAGCSSQRAPIPQDPLEGLNRATFAFNNVVDKSLIKPVAGIYDMIFPNFFKKGVDNFFRNLGETDIIVNNILQTEYYAAFQDFGRLVFNSTFGLGGLVDVATEVNIPRNYQDFGLTFARWGVKNSDYLVLPILGPSTIRDGIGMWIDFKRLLVYPYIPSSETSYALLGLNIIDIRTQLLPTDPLIDKSFDPYVFVRDAYLQNRSYLIKLQTAPAGVDTYVEEYRPLRPGVSAAPTGAGEDTYVPAEEPAKTEKQKK